MSQSRFNHVFLTQRVILLRTLQRMVHNHQHRRGPVAGNLPARDSGLLEAGQSTTLNPLSTRQPATWRWIACVRAGFRRVPCRRMSRWMSCKASPRRPARRRKSYQSRAATGAPECQPRPVERPPAADFHPQPSARLQYQEIADQLGVSLSTVQKELKLIMAICGCGRTAGSALSFTRQRCRSKL